MKIALVMPCVGKKPRGGYVRTWLMEPLAIAALAALTPEEHELVFYDDRIESPDYDCGADIAAITVETYTAARAYEIAAEYRKRGAKVVMGGFHATLATEDALAHADAVVVGQAEGAWQRLLGDASQGRLERLYENRGPVSPVTPDKSIYAKYRYMAVNLVETGRGCRFDCGFCSVCNFFGHAYSPRPIDEVAAEMRASPKRVFFFIDDNLGADKEHLRALLSAIQPLGAKWVAQISLDAARDPALVDAMADSGCIGVLIGFESLDPGNLASMNKAVNRRPQDYSAAVAAFRRRKIAIYATFLFGFQADTAASFRPTLEFALKEKFFFAAFNHLVPFPGTPLYAELESKGRLLYPKWWLEPGYRFGQAAFRPEGMAPEDLTRLCLEYRRKFHSFPSLLSRSLSRANASSLMKFLIFWGQGLANRGDVERRQGLPLGGGAA